MSLFGKDYPETWRIDDWHDPWLPLPVRILNAVPDALARCLIALDENRLFARARRETGLQDFGDEDFLIPFRIVLEDLNAADNITMMGRVTALTVLHEQLCARLCLQDKLKHSPEIQQQRIDKPLIIAGLPRTGTTHLHNLLSTNTHLRYMPFWQTLYPVAPSLGEQDRRRRAADLAVWAAGYIVPLMKRMHEMQTDEPHEELTICAIGYRSFFFEGIFQVPKYRAWYAGHSQEKGYEYLKQVLQILQTEPAPGNKAEHARWVLKSPQHIEHLQSMVNVFPDARVILTHRDPARAVLSIVTMILYGSRQVYRPTRLREEASAWVDRLEQMLRRSREQAKLLPPAQVMDVHFDAFMKNSTKTVRDILDFAEVPFSSDSEAALKAHLESHTRDLHGRIDYRFEDLGLNEAEIRERFSLY